MPSYKSRGLLLPDYVEKGAKKRASTSYHEEEMYVQGVYTRKVKAITEELCGVEISAMQVSRAAA